MTQPPNLSNSPPPPTAAREGDAAALAAIQAVVGERGWIADESDMAPYLHDQRGLYVGRCRAVVRPANREEVAAVIRICAEAQLPVVPQGGNTGLVGGSVPSDDGRGILLSLARMTRIRAIDPINNTMTVEAGCVLANLQQAAAEAGRLFPLSLGAEGSCMIGGNLSTNAGGVQVLRYGNARNLVLGLEVVLPDGTLWDGLRGLRKDNTGYDLKQLFVGAEGTLGVITAAVLRLFPRPGETVTAFAAVPKLSDVMILLGEAQAASGEAVGGFELIPRLGVELAVKHFADMSAPMATDSPWYVLMEFTAGGSSGRLRETVEEFLAANFESGRVTDAVIAASESQARQLWRLREILPEAQTREGGSIKHDVAVPISRIADFIAEGTRRLEAAMAGIRVFPFGHVGDGNIHFNVSQPVGMDKATFLTQWNACNQIVHDLVAEMNGSFSAEHGIGQLKKEELHHYRAPGEIDLMRKIKAALDPQGIMNPGKILTTPFATRRAAMVDAAPYSSWPPIATIWRKIMLVWWLLAIATVITLSLLPNVGPPGSYHLDKFIHALSYCGLALLPAAVFKRRRGALIAAIAMIALGCGVEVLQIFVPQRAGDIWDAIANSIGAFIGAAGAPPFRRLVRHMTAR